MFLIFEGADKSGKTTIIKEFHKATNFKYSCIDRFSGTSFAYNLFWERNLNNKEYLLQDISSFDKAILIYLEVPTEVAAVRFKEHNEKDLDIKDYDKLKESYEIYLKGTPLYIVRINTNKSISETVKEIIKFIEDFENESLINKKLRLIKGIEYFGEVINKTKELRNINFSYSKNNLKDISISEINEEEMPEYDNIYYSLKNTIRLKLNYFKNQTIDSRQFIYHSDSCISMFQVMKRNNNLECFVKFRSCNVKENLLSDCIGIYKIASRINNVFFNCENIKINVNIGSAHIFI
jgi:hypothetical protein